MKGAAPVVPYARGAFCRGACRHLRLPVATEAVNTRLASTCAYAECSLVFAIFVDTDLHRIEVFAT